MNPRPHRSPTAADRHLESGFTLVELLVVMVIVGILMAVMVPMFTGQKRAASTRQAIAAAAQYNDSVVSYMADNGNRVPGYGTAGWPVKPAGSVHGSGKDGPVNTLTGKSYFGNQAPEAVVRGGEFGVALTFNLRHAQAAKGAQIDYAWGPTGAAAFINYNLAVYDADHKQVCYFGNVAPANPPAGGWQLCK